MPTKVRAIRHLEFLPDSFDAGSNQVSDIKVSNVVLFWKNRINFCTILVLFFNLWQPDCFRDLKLPKTC